MAIYHVNYKKLSKLGCNFQQIQSKLQYVAKYST